MTCNSATTSFISSTNLTVSYSQSLLREADSSEVNEALNRIIDVLSKLNLPSPVVDKTSLESAVSECNEDVQPETSDKVIVELQWAFFTIYNTINVIASPMTEVPLLIFIKSPNPSCFTVLKPLFP